MKPILFVFVLLVVYISAAQQCQLCKDLVLAVKSELKNYDGKITDLFKKQVCTRFQKMEQPCERFVDLYGVRVIDFLIQKINPEFICKKLNLCDNKEWIRKIFTPEEARNFMIASMKKSNENTCDLCEYLVFEIESYVNKSKPEIEKALVKSCEKLEQQYRSICDTVVLVYGPQIIDWILTHQNPETLCTELHLCKAKTQKKFVGNTQCELCTYVVQQVETFISQNSTEQEIERDLHKLCESLPTSFGKQCNALVDEYVPYIIYYVKQAYPPQKVCQIISLCPKGEVKKQANDVECFLCTKLVGIAEKYLETNKTEAEIEALLDKFCDQAPFGKKDYCKSVVHQYLPYIIHFLSQKYPPKTVCEMISLCQKATQVSTLQKCPTCMIVSEALLKLVGEVVTRQEVEKALEKVCDKVNPSIQPQCKIMVDEFAMPIIEAVVQRATPSVICKLIKMCN